MKIAISGRHWWKLAEGDKGGEHEKSQAVGFGIHLVAVFKDFMKRDFNAKPVPISTSS